ncbi:MAG: omptin family outer membrane protease [Treponema sp.]|nr:omptin family outer membrane protease [Treponema sp.]
MNHSIKSIAAFAFLVIILLCNSVFAAAESPSFTDKYCFSFSSNIGFLYGTSYEIVYKNSNSNDYLSELQWEIKPLLYFGIDLDYGLKNPINNHGFFVGLGLKAAIPMETGIMEDRDWIEPCTKPGSLTNFSSHENHTKASFLVNLETGYSIPFWKLILKFSLNFDYMYFNFEGQNGYTQHGPNDLYAVLLIPWDSTFDQIPWNGLAISYTQHWLLFNTGMEVVFPINNITLSAGFFIGPSICFAVDHHEGGYTFVDTLYKGFAIKPKLGVFFSLTDKCDIGITTAYHHNFETRGNTTQKLGSYMVQQSIDRAGVAFRAFEGNFVIRYRFIKK